MKYESLKQIRENKGYSQRQVASFLGMSQASYNRKENGKRKFELEEAFMLEDFFNIPIHVLFQDLKKRFII